MMVVVLLVDGQLGKQTSSGVGGNQATVPIAKSKAGDSSYLPTWADEATFHHVWQRRQFQHFVSVRGRAWTNTTLRSAKWSCWRGSSFWPLEELSCLILPPPAERGSQRIRSQQAEDLGYGGTRALANDGFWLEVWWIRQELVSWTNMTGHDWQLRCAALTGCWDWTPGEPLWKCWRTKNLWLRNKPFPIITGSDWSQHHCQCANGHHIGQWHPV